MSDKSKLSSCNYWETDLLESEERFYRGDGALVGSIDEVDTEGRKAKIWCAKNAAGEIIGHYPKKGCAQGAVERLCQ